jgi:hypothetical protein
MFSLRPSLENVRQDFVRLGGSNRRFHDYQHLNAEKNP